MNEPFQEIAVKIDRLSEEISICFYTEHQFLFR